MSNIWSDIDAKAKHLVQTMHNGLPTSSALAELQASVPHDWALEEPACYAWGAMLTNYLHDATKAVLAAGPCQIVSPNVATFSRESLWRRDFEIAKKCNVSSVYVHPRPIIDVVQGKVLRVHVPPKLTTIIQKALLEGKRFADCCWVTLDDGPHMFPVAYGVSKGSLMVFDCENILPSAGEVRRAFQCITAGNVHCKWSNAQHLYRTAHLKKCPEPAVLCSATWMDMSHHDQVTANNDESTKFHNGSMFEWSEDGGFWLGSGGTLAHGLTMLSTKSFVNQQVEPNEGVYFPVLALYNYFKVTAPERNAADLATDTFLAACRNKT